MREVARVKIENQGHSPTTMSMNNHGLLAEAENVKQYFDAAKHLMQRDMRKVRKD
jgi:hypothetical protein